MLMRWKTCWLVYSLLPIPHYRFQLLIRDCNYPLEIAITHYRFQLLITHYRFQLFITHYRFQLFITHYRFQLFITHYRFKCRRCVNGIQIKSPPEDSDCRDSLALWNHSADKKGLADVILKGVWQSLISFVYHHRSHDQQKITV